IRAVLQRSKGENHPRRPAGQPHGLHWLGDELEGLAVIRAPQLGDHPGGRLDSYDFIAEREQPLHPAAHSASGIYDGPATGQQVPHLIPGHSVVGAPVRALEVLAVAGGKRRIELLARLHVLTSPCPDDGVRSATASRPPTSWAATPASGSTS